MSLNPWELAAANGCIVSLDGAKRFPKAKADTAQADDPVGFLNKKAKSSIHLPEVVIFEHINFGGNQARTNLNWDYVGDWWNDKISSIVVVSGVWRFYEHTRRGGRRWELSPGYYNWVEASGIPNDTISSFQAISY